jgi:hypothetical protein
MPAAAGWATLPAAVGYGIYQLISFTFAVSSHLNEGAFL